MRTAESCYLDCTPVCVRRLDSSAADARRRRPRRPLSRSLASRSTWPRRQASSGTSRRREKVWQATLPQRAHCRSRAGAMQARRAPVQQQGELTKASPAPHRAQRAVHRDVLRGCCWLPRVDPWPPARSSLFGPCADWTQARVGGQLSRARCEVQRPAAPMRSSPKAYSASAETSLTSPALLASTVSHPIHLVDIINIHRIPRPPVHSMHRKSQPTFTCSHDPSTCPR